MVYFISQFPVRVHHSGKGPTVKSREKRMNECPLVSLPSLLSHCRTQTQGVALPTFGSWSRLHPLWIQFMQNFHVSSYSSYTTEIHSWWNCVQHVLWMSYHGRFEAAKTNTRSSERAKPSICTSNSVFIRRLPSCSPLQ